MRATVVAILLLTVALLPGGATAQADTGSVEVRVVACPSGVAEADRAERCVASIGGDPLVLDGPVRREATTGADGTARFEGLPAGDYTIAEAVLQGNFADYAVACTDATGTAVPVERRANGRAAALVTLGEGETLTCTWYNLPPAGSAPAAAGDLPATGIGPSSDTPTRLTIALLAASIASLALALLLIDPRAPEH